MPLMKGRSMVRPQPKVRRARAGSGVCRLKRQRRSGTCVSLRILALHRTGGVDVQRVHRMARNGYANQCRAWNKILDDDPLTYAFLSRSFVIVTSSAAVASSKHISGTGSL